MSLVRFQDRENKNVSPVLNDLFESVLNDSFFSDRMISRVPAVNIAETDSGYHIELAAPGLKKEDFKINLDQNILSITVEKKSEQTEDNKKYNKVEYSYTSFVRSFNLPETADDGSIEAEYTDGVLRINVAKKEESKMATRQIEIK